MGLEIRFVESDEDRQAIYRLWYRVEVGEKRRFIEIADRRTEQLIWDSVKPTDRLLGAFENGEARGSLRIRWGAEDAFEVDEFEELGLVQFKNVLSVQQTIILDYIIVESGFRDGFIPLQLCARTLEFAIDHDVLACFSVCGPLSLGIYRQIGFQTYARGFTRPEYGYMIPVSIVADLDDLHQQGSPVGMMPELLAKGPSSTAARVLTKAIQDAEGSASAVGDQLEALAQTSLFYQMTVDRIRRCLPYCLIIDCRPGERMIIEGVPNDGSVFVVLEGMLEIRQAGQQVGVLTTGEFFGASGFARQGEHSVDVVAMTHDTEVLVLTEVDLNRLIENEPRIASRLLMNLAQLFSAKLNMHESRLMI